MSVEECVDGAQVSISPVAPTVLVTTSSSVPSVGGQTKSKPDGSFCLVQSDIVSWAPTFTSQYTSGSYTTPGTVIGSAVVVTGLAIKNIAGGFPIVLKTTTYVLTLTVTVPATQPAVPTPIPDPVLTKTANVSFTDAGQTRCKGL